MIRDNILILKKRIETACIKVRRDPQAVTLVAVSKNRTLEEIGKAIEAGITDIGESRVQEAIIKYNQLVADSSQLAGAKWHMIGHLQTNKVKETVRIFDLIHSVDSLRLAQEIDKQAARINKVQDILIEVKTSPEAAKLGLSPEETIALIPQLKELKNINIRGLMTIAPAASDSQEARPYFKALRELRDKIYQLPVTSYQLLILSMGMSDDFEIAIEEGADMLRIGRAIFQ